MKDTDRRYAPPILFTPSTLPLAPVKPVTRWEQPTQLSPHSRGQDLGVKIATLILRLFRVGGLMWRIHLRFPLPEREPVVDVTEGGTYLLENRFDWPSRQ